MIQYCQHFRRICTVTAGTASCQSKTWVINTFFTSYIITIYEALSISIHNFSLHNSFIYSKRKKYEKKTSTLRWYSLICKKKTKCIHVIYDCLYTINIQVRSLKSIQLHIGKKWVVKNLFLKLSAHEPKAD